MYNSVNAGPKLLLSTAAVTRCVADCALVPAAFGARVVLMCMGPHVFTALFTCRVLR